MGRLSTNRTFQVEEKNFIIVIFVTHLLHNFSQSFYSLSYQKSSLPFILFSSFFLIFFRHRIRRLIYNPLQPSREEEENRHDVKMLNNRVSLV